MSIHSLFLLVWFSLKGFQEYYNLLFDIRIGLIFFHESSTEYLSCLFLEELKVDVCEMDATHGKVRTRPLI